MAPDVWHAAPGRSPTITAMAIIKSRLKGGKISWGYLFSVGPRAARHQYKEQGFTTRKSAAQVWDQMQDETRKDKRQ